MEVRQKVVLRPLLGEPLLLRRKMKIDAGKRPITDKSVRTKQNTTRVEVLVIQTGWFGTARDSSTTIPAILSM